MIVYCHSGAAEKSSQRIIAFYPLAGDFVFPVLPSISRNAEILSHANKTRSSAAVDRQRLRGEENAMESC